MDRTPTNTNEVSRVLGSAGPQSNTYQASAATSSAAIRNQTASLGHNVFRPDVYKVSEGYLS